MNGEQLYQGLKAGQINKTQLTNKELGEVYKYMVNSNRVSVKEIKSSVAQRFGLSANEYKPLKVEVPEIEIPETERPEKQSLFGKIGNFFKTQSQTQPKPQFQPINTTVNPRVTTTTPQIKPQSMSTNPELELVDLLSNLSMPKTEPTLDRGRTTKHERSQGSAYVPGNIVQPTPTGLTLGDRVEQGIKGIGYNWLGGMLSASGTGSEFLGTNKEIVANKGMKTDKGFDLSLRIQPSAKELMQASDELLAKGQQHTAKGREGLGTAGGIAYDILTGAGQMGADIGTAAVTGVGMLPVLGTRVFGQSASEARQSGADINQQIAYGAISAGIEIATEKLVGGLPMAEKLGMGGVADNTIKKLASGIASSPRLAKAFTYLANMAGEGAEEMIAEILSPIAKRMTYDKNADWATIEEVLYSGLLGAGISGVMGGGVLLQGNNQTPTETPTQTQSVMTNENIEPDIQGFQNTIDTGLNQLYNVLDSGQTDEQAINTMVTNLEQVKKLMPTLSEYVDGHIERLSNYKVIEQPQTNEIEEAEQTFNDDVNIAQIEDKGVTEDIKDIDTQIDDNVADTQTPTIEQEEIEEIELPTAEDYLQDMEQDMQIEEDYSEGTIIQAKNGDIYKVTAKDGDTYIVTNERTKQENNYTLGGLKRLGTVLQGSKEVVNETQQIDNVTNVTENVGYHAGDLGKADYLNIMPGRGTGHFGTGTYFVGNKKDIDFADYKDRPMHTVSFEGYNLYKPKTTEEAINLHRFLKNINDMSFRSEYKDVVDDIINGKVDDDYIDNLISTKFPYNSEFDFNIDYSDINDTDDIEKMLKQIDKKISETNIPPEVEERKRNIEQYQYFLDKLIDNIENVKQELKDKFNFSDEKIYKTIKELYQYGTSNLKSNKMDSPSTVFMKSLGYEGVDVRGLKGLDDTEFGSVIYDLKDTPQATEQPTTKETIPTEQIVEEDKYIIKKGDYVKIDGIGIGKAASDNSVEISGKRYYRDTEDTDYSKSTAVEYWQDLQKQIKELKNIAKEKRKEAADYNKETGGMATKRKGKISMGDGRGVGFAENSVSAYHRKLLSEAKEFSDKANQLSKLVDERKAQLENRVRNNIPLYDYTEEAEALGVKITKQTPSAEDKSETKTDVAENTTTEKQTYRYYLTQRPPSPGTFPKGTTDVVSFDTKQETDGLEAWGYVEYDKPLTEKQIDDYELTENVTETKQLTTGKKGIAKDNEGNTIEFIYEVVNANDLITSHTTELAVNNNYPSELQPRERTRAASQLQVNDIINNLQPEFLGENPKISDGSPIVGNDNIVESGNGRTIALTKMYQLKHDNQTKYVEWLKNNAETFGIDKDNLPDNPVLIRRRTTEVDRADFVKKANESSIATMSATETARSDADKLTNEVLSMFIANDNGIINTTENKGFIGKFINDVIPKNEQNKYITDKGELSQEGLARVRNAIFYKAYGDINLMNKLAESLDNNAKNITNTMLAIAPKVVDIKVNISKGNLHNVDYSSSIAQAANEYMALKESGKDVELYLQQESLFDNEDTALIKDIIAIFNTNNRSVKRMSTIFNKLFDSVENLGNPNQINMFSETETPDRVSVLEETLRRLENEDNAQITLFQSGREESSESSRSDSGEQGKTKGYKGGQSFTGATTASLVDMSRKLKKPTEIRKDITKKFGVPTTSKKFNRSKKFLGYYKVIPEVIRLRYDNQIGTVMHELGHHLDKKYEFNSLNKQLITDMINKMNPTFKNNYQKSELPGEAIAEFLRYYTTDPTTAEQFAGDFYDLFEHTLSKDDLKNIQEIRSDVLRWVNAERSEKRQSTIAPLSEQQSKNRISSALEIEKKKMHFFNKYAPFERFANTVKKLTGKDIKEEINPYILAERTNENNTIIEWLIRGQAKDAKLNPLNTKDNLQNIVNDLKKDVPKFEDYIKLKHAITLAKKGHMVYNTEIYSDVALMEQDLATIEQQYPNFVEISERLYDWYDKIFKAWVIDTKMLGENSEEIYDTMREEYPYYVPGFRVKEELVNKGGKNSFADQKAPVDRLSAKGSDTDTIAPLDNVITQIARMVNAHTKNNVMRALVENYNTVDGLGGFIDKVPPDMVKQIVSTEDLKKMLEKDFENINDIEDILDSIPDTIQTYKPKSKSSSYDIVGVINKEGKREFYQVFDANLLEALTNMNPVQMDGYVRMIGAVRRSVTAMTTGLNPIFGLVSNPFRDFGEAAVYGSHDNMVEFVFNYMKALNDVLKKNKNYVRFKETGGVFGSSMTTEIRNKNEFIRHLDAYRKGKPSIKNALSFVGEMILDFNDAIETTPRLSEYKKALEIAKKQGKDDYNAHIFAMDKAKDVTLNFQRKGTIMNELPGQSIPYSNPALQGLEKMKRKFIDSEDRKKVWINTLTVLVIPTVLLWAAHKDDEDYEKLSQGIKDNYWILNKRADGSFIRIPKPKDVAVLFSSSVERAMDKFFKDDKEAFDGFKLVLFDALFPPVDTIARPIIDIGKNKKWSGGKIVSTELEYRSKEAQYDDTTSKIGIALAHTVNKVVPGHILTSPKNMDYFLDQYFGGLADVLLPMTTPNSYTTTEFLRRKFSADPSFSNNAVNDFYDLRDKTMKANKSYKDKKIFNENVDFVAEKELNLYYKGISSQWKAVDFIGTLEGKTLSNEQKSTFIQLIEKSRYSDSMKEKVKNKISTGKLDKQAVTLLQKTIRDEIVKLADKAVKNYKENHKSNNEQLKNFISNQGQ